MSSTDANPAANAAAAVVAAPADDTSESLTGDALTAALRKQIEFYFSRANLAQVTFFFLCTSAVQAQRPLCLLCVRWARVWRRFVINRTSSL